MVLADIHTLHESDLYRIKNFKCHCTECSTSPVEYSKTFCICFVRSGFFEYRIFRRDLEVHIGRVLITKPAFEHITKHIDNQPDVCSVFEFTSGFYERLKAHYGANAGWFFNNPDIHSLLLHTNPELEYLHHTLWTKLLADKHDHLLIDDLVIQLADTVLCTITNGKQPAPLPDGTKKFHLQTIENAKDFILNHFERNITLKELAAHCCVSVFHFSRLFKSIMNVSPYKYLTSIRLNHAKMLLETSGIPVQIVADRCGFNSLEQFSAIYKQYFRMSPTAFRKAIAG